MTQEKFEGLLNENKSSIYQFCIQLTKNKPDADDLFQDTFIMAFRKHELIDESQNPKSYLYAVCLNLWKTSKRKNTAALCQEEYNLLISPENPEEIIIFREERERIAQIVGNLKEKLRLPMYLYYTVGLPLAEIAQALKIPEGTVKSRLHKARSILRERLVKEYDNQ